MPPKTAKGKAAAGEQPEQPERHYTARDLGAAAAAAAMATQAALREPQQDGGGGGGSADDAGGAELALLAAPDARRRHTEPVFTTGLYDRIMEVVSAKKIARAQGTQEEITFRNITADPETWRVKAFFTRVFDGAAYLTEEYEAELFVIDRASSSVVIRPQLHTVVPSADPTWWEKAFANLREARPLFSDLTKLEAARLMYLAYCFQRKQPAQDPCFPKLSEIYMKSKYVQPPIVSGAQARDRQIEFLSLVRVGRLEKTLLAPRGVPDRENDFLNSMRKGILEHVEQMFRDKRVNNGKIPDVLVATFMLVLEMIEAIRVARGTDVQEAYYIAEELDAFCLRLLIQSNYFISNGLTIRKVPVLGQELGHEEEAAQREVVTGKALDFALIDRIRLSTSSLLDELKDVCRAPDFEQHVQLVTQRHTMLLRAFENVMEEVRHMLTPQEEQDISEMRSLDRVLAFHDLSAATPADPFARYPWYSKNLLPVEKLLFHYVALQKKEISKTYRQRLMDFLKLSEEEREARKQEFNQELDSPYISDRFLAIWQKLVIAAFEPLKTISQSLHTPDSWVEELTEFLSTWLNDFVRLMDLVNRNFYNLKLFLNTQPESGELIMLGVIHAHLVGLLDENMDILETFQHSVGQLKQMREALSTNGVASALLTTCSDLQAAKSLQTIISRLDIVRPYTLRLINELVVFKQYITEQTSPVVKERFEQLKQTFQAVGYVNQRLQGSALRLLPSVGRKDDPVMRGLIDRIRYRNEHPLPAVTFGRGPFAALAAADSLIPVDVPRLDMPRDGAGAQAMLPLVRLPGGGAGAAGIPAHPQITEMPAGDVAHVSPLSSVAQKLGINTAADDATLLQAVKLRLEELLAEKNEGQRLLAVAHLSHEATAEDLLRTAFGMAVDERLDLAVCYQAVDRLTAPRPETPPAPAAVTPQKSRRFVMAARVLSSGGNGGAAQQSSTPAMMPAGSAAGGDRERESSERSSAAGDEVVRGARRQLSFSDAAATRRVYSIEVQNEKYTSFHGAVLNCLIEQPLLSSPSALYRAIPIIDWTQLDARVCRRVMMSLTPDVLSIHDIPIDQAVKKLLNHFSALTTNEGHIWKNFLFPHYKERQKEIRDQRNAKLRADWLAARAESDAFDDAFGSDVGFGKLKMFTPARPPEPPKECPVVTDLPAYTAEQSEQYRKKATLVLAVKCAGHVVKHCSTDYPEMLLSATNEMLVKSIVSYCAVRQADGPAGGGFVVDAQATLEAMKAPDELLRGVMRAIFEHNPYGMADNLREYLQRTDHSPEMGQYCEALKALLPRGVEPSRGAPVAFR